MVQDREKGGPRLSDKRKKFIRLAEARVARAIGAIRILGNLSNTSNYEYREEDAKKIISALQSELNDLKKKFATRDKTASKAFKLKD